MNGHKGVKEARFDLLPWDALWLVARLYGKGAEKYAARNWERGYEYSKSVGALGRHLALLSSGEWVDPETKLPHACSIVFHALALLTFEIREVGIDDLPKGAVEFMQAALTNPEEIEAARAEAGG